MAPRLSAWLWQPDGLDIANLGAIRATCLPQRAAEDAEPLSRVSAREFGRTLAFKQETGPAQLGPEPEPFEFGAQIVRAEEKSYIDPVPAEPADPRGGRTRNIAWLLSECLLSLAGMGLDDATEVQAAELVIKTKQVVSSPQSDDEIQGELLDLLGFDRFDFIAELIANRASIASMSVPPQAKKLLKSVEKHRARCGPGQNHMQQGSNSALSHADFVAQARAARSKQPSDAATLKKLGYSDGVEALRTALPAGAVRITHQRYEQWDVPAPSPEHVAEARRKAAGNVKGDVELVEIARLPAFTHKVFAPITSLNRLQSACFEAAFHSAENLMVCAPTGSGKTNVAMLSLLREIGRQRERHKSPGGGPDPIADFKIVYLAPLKALAAEVARKYSKQLAPLNIRVKELTGDTKLSRADISRTHVLVATPEKWDVITRKSADAALAQQLRLLIIDEVHLLHEERGAVLESLVVRTLRLSEATQQPCRIVALSATLPNYRDVAQFLRVREDKGCFYFDAAFRPVPLEQRFFGVKERDPWKQKKSMNEVAWQQVSRSVEEGNQCLVFVHSRNETVKVAQDFLGRMREEGKDYSAKTECASWELERAKLARSRNNEMKELFDGGLGTHHAGMLRSDRNLMEQGFEKGLIKVLVSTSTLAWGVNLPAHTVVIRGTQIFDSKKGGFVEMSMQDVMQCFGRAGRPQFDTSGEGVIITQLDTLPHYLKSLNNGLPIESSFLPALENHLVAEVVLGNITNLAEAVEWLSMTYMQARASRCPNPLEYGITLAERHADPALLSWRTKLATKAAEKLGKARMLVFVQSTGALRPASLGRIASVFYVDHATIDSFTNPNEGVQEWMDDADILRVLGSAAEFEGVKVRQEELHELDGLANGPWCEVEIKGGGVEHTSGKVNVLLQAYLGNKSPSAFSLVIDQMYVAREAGRLLRALFEMLFFSMALQRSDDGGGGGGWVHSAMAVLELTKAVEKRAWHTRHPLAQLGPSQPGLSPAVLNLLEADHVRGGRFLSIERLRTMGPAELEAAVARGITGASARAGRGAMVKGAELARTVRYLPQPRARVEMRPLLRVPRSGDGAETSVLVQVHAFMSADFEWSDKLHPGGSEPFLVYVQDDGSRLLHFDTATLSKAAGGGEVGFTFHLLVPLPLPDAPWFLFAESERWMGVHASAEICFDERIFRLPRALPSGGSSGSTAQGGGDTLASAAAPALAVTAAERVPIAAVGPCFQEFFLSNLAVGSSGNSGTAADASSSSDGESCCFSEVESTLLDTLFREDFDVLLAAAAGNGVGNGTCSELTLCRFLETHPLPSPTAADAEVLCLTVTQATARLRLSSWQRRLTLVRGAAAARGAAALSISRATVTQSKKGAVPHPRVLVMTGEEWLQLPAARREHLASSVGLLLAEELHLLGDLQSHGGSVPGNGVQRMPGAAMELALLSLLHHPEFVKRREEAEVRVVGLSGASLAPESAEDLAQWLGVRAWSRPSARSLWNFGNGVRPVQQELLVKKFEEKLSTPRLASMNKSCFQALVTNRGPAPGGGRHGQLQRGIVFVSSPRQVWLTAQALISLSMMNMGQSGASGSSSGGDGGVFVSDELRCALDDILHSDGRQKGGRKPAVGGMLSQVLRWGVGLHYGGMSPADATLVESLWQSGLLKVLIATPELAWTTPSQASSGLVAPLVVIKGTTRALPGGQRGEQAYSQSEMLQLIGRACWAADDPSEQPPAEAWDDSAPQPPRKARVVVLCQDILKDYWVTALFCPMALESSLHKLSEAAATEAGQALVLSGFIAPQTSGAPGLGNDDNAVDAAAVEELLRASFLARRVRSNPSFYSAGTGANRAASSGNARHLLLKRVRELAERA